MATSEIAQHMEKMTADQYKAIGRVAAWWSRFEADVATMLWRLTGLESGLGACLTAQIPNVSRLLDGLVALVAYRGGSKELLTRLNKFKAKTHAHVSSSASACSSQKRMSISRYIAVAVAKCSCAAKSPKLLCSTTQFLNLKDIGWCACCEPFACYLCFARLRNQAPDRMAAKSVMPKTTRPRARAANSPLSEPVSRRAAHPPTMEMKTRRKPQRSGQNSRPAPCEVK